MKGTEGEALRNAYLKVTVNSAPRRLYFRDVSTYAKLPRRTLPPLPPYSPRKPHSETELTESDERRE